MASPSLTSSPPSAREYRLSDDLARLCLPQEFKDSCRKLAWANSICALFLAVGLFGLKAPKVIVRPIHKPVESVPVLFAPAEEQPKLETQEKLLKEPDQPQETAIDTPQVVVAVVATDDAPNIAFAVPVQGVVAVAPAARLAPPPPTVIRQAPPPGPQKFNSSAQEVGNYPPPSYPAVAKRNGYQGTVIVEIMVDASGVITSAKVQKSSGFPVLDEAALQVVKNRWRFPPGGPRWFLWPCQFQIN